jgi:hypothetical protein
MKIRNDREALHLPAFPKLLVLGEKDPFYDMTKKQVENTEVELVVFRWTYEPY